MSAAPPTQTELAAAAAAAAAATHKAQRAKEEHERARKVAEEAYQRWKVDYRKAKEKQNTFMKLAACRYGAPPPKQHHWEL